MKYLIKTVFFGIAISFMGCEFLNPYEEHEEPTLFEGRWEHTHQNYQADHPQIYQAKQVQNYHFLSQNTVEISTFSHQYQDGKWNETLIERETKKFRKDGPFIEIDFKDPLLSKSLHISGDSDQATISVGNVWASSNGGLKADIKGIWESQVVYSSLFDEEIWDITLDFQDDDSVVIRYYLNNKLEFAEINAYNDSSFEAPGLRMFLGLEDDTFLYELTHGHLFSTPKFLEYQRP